jgi:hypothetical protein
MSLEEIIKNLEPVVKEVLDNRINIHNLSALIGVASHGITGIMLSEMIYSKKIEQWKKERFGKLKTAGLYLESIVLAGLPDADILLKPLYQKHPYLIHRGISHTIIGAAAVGLLTMYFGQKFIYGFSLAYSNPVVDIVEGAENSVFYPLKEMRSEYLFKDGSNIRSAIVGAASLGILLAKKLYYDKFKYKEGTKANKMLNFFKKAEDKKDRIYYSKPMFYIGHAARSIF